MKRVCFTLLAVYLLAVTLCACADKSVQRDTAQEVVEGFFALYAQGRYDDMKTHATEEFAASFLSNLPVTGVYGMKTAELTDCGLVEEDSGEDRTVFFCTFEMTPMEDSVYEEGQTEARFFVDTQRVDGVWKLSSFHTG